jgi:hypothetical protein
MRPSALRLVTAVDDPLRTCGSGRANVTAVRLCVAKQASETHASRQLKRVHQ